jgi:hypothetical protein
MKEDTQNIQEGMLELRQETEDEEAKIPLKRFGDILYDAPQSTLC